MKEYQYLAGFGNHHESEAIEGAIPLTQNVPQRVPFGLYAEQLSGTAFTAPREHNQKTWLYRIQPSVTHQPFKSTSLEKQLKSGLSPNFSETYCDITPNQLRWSPFTSTHSADKKVDFVDGLSTICGAGDPSLRTGLAIHVYLANTSMGSKSFYNADGDMLIVPQQGRLDIQTEMGFLMVEPSEIAVIPRGELPDLGPIGANGLAAPRHFLYPKAAYQDEALEWTMINKYQGRLFSAQMDHSPFNVVGWSGIYAPYKYDLRLFNTINSVSFDHPTSAPGVGLADFVIFPPRWMVAKNTFRPPYFHRNIMSEFMGLISGEYDAKSGGFSPGGGSLHSIMTPHGPDSETYTKAVSEELKPVYQDGGIAFMFESSLFLSPTRWALYGDYGVKAKDEGKKNVALQADYNNVWQGLRSRFNIPQ